jgi:GNAT superfamily N-acetyltransferase
MEIRPATSKDAPSLGALMVSAWLSAHRGQMREDAWNKRKVEWTPEVSAAGWARVLAEQAACEVPADVLLVADADEGPVGLAYACIDESSSTMAEIKALYVATGRRGEGVGRALLQAIAEELRRLGCATVRLEVLSANLPARGFYEHLGGRQIGNGWFDEGGQLQPVTYYEWECERLSTGMVRRAGLESPSPGAP